METDPSLSLKDIGALGEFLVAEGWQVNASARGLTVTHPNDSSPLMVEIVWMPDRGLVYFRTPFAVRVSPEQKPKAAVTVAELNTQLAAGSFQLRTGVIFEWTAFTQPDGSLASHSAQRGIELCRATAKEYRAPISQLAADT